MNRSMKPAIIAFPMKRGREPGALSVAQEPDLPFLPKRLYWIYGVPEGIMRGGHAHKELWQVLVCLHGSITVHLEDGMGWREAMTLDNPAQGLLLPPPFWHTITFGQPDSVLLAIASDVYDESDYIRDYGEFLRTRQPDGRRKSSRIAPSADEPIGVEL